MIALYATPELKAVAEDVESTLERIMAEAAGRESGTVSVTAGSYACGVLAPLGQDVHDSRATGPHGAH